MVNALLTDCSIGGAVITTDEQLTKLIREAKQHAPDSLEWQKALTQLVDTILRSRKICRTLGNQCLFGVYEEIYREVRQQLLHDVGEALSKYNPQLTPVREWINTLRNNAFKNVLDDARLKELALTAQQTQLQTEERQYALRELVEAIRLSGRLIRPRRTICSPGSYNPIYEEAVNRTLIYVCQRIENYDPTRGKGRFMNWVNERLKWLIIEVQREFPTGNDFPPEFDVPQPENPPSLVERIQECIAEDAKNTFKKAHMRNCPDANFQAIALAVTSGKTLAEISAEFGVKLPAVRNFFRRCCQRFESDIKECL